MNVLNKEVKNLVLFSSGKLISVFGSLIYSFAMSLYILKLTGDGLSFATNMVLGMVPVILISPVAGALADKLNRKLLVILMDVLSGILLVGLYFYIHRNGLDVMTIYITTFFLTIFGVIFSISLESAKPSVVSEHRLMTINSISKIIDSTSSILAPILGGIIYALVENGVFNIEIFIIMNGISFILSAVSEFFINFDLNNGSEVDSDQEDDDDAQVQGEKQSMIRNILEGVYYLKKNDQLKVLITYFIVLNFFIGLTLLVPLPFIINEVLMLDSTYYGIIQGSFPVGMILGALVVKKVSNRLPYDQLVQRMILTSALIMMSVACPLLLPQLFISKLYYLMFYSLLMLSLGIVIAFIDIPILYLLQKIIDEDYRGRVMSLVMSLAKIISPIALLLSGMLINYIPPWMLPLFGGGLQLLYAMNRMLKGKKDLV